MLLMYLSHVALASFDVQTFDANVEQLGPASDEALQNGWRAVYPSLVSCPDGSVGVNIADPHGTLGGNFLLRIDPTGIQRLRLPETVPHLLICDDDSALVAYAVPKGSALTPAWYDVVRWDPRAAKVRRTRVSGANHHATRLVALADGGLALAAVKGDSATPEVVRLAPDGSIQHTLAVESVGDGARLAVVSLARDDNELVLLVRPSKGSEFGPVRVLRERVADRTFEHAQTLGPGYHEAILSAGGFPAEGLRRGTYTWTRTDRVDLLGSVSLHDGGAASVKPVLEGVPYPSQVIAVGDGVAAFHELVSPAPVVYRRQDRKWSSESVATGNASVHGVGRLGDRWMVALVLWEPVEVAGRVLAPQGVGPDRPILVLLPLP